MKISNQKTFEQALRKKIVLYRKYDKKKGYETASFAEFLAMVDACTATCSRCSCTMLFEDYKPYCYYQFSFDRLDNNKGHVAGNMEIVCWHCNSVDYVKVRPLGFVRPKKPMCLQACHGYVFDANPETKSWRCARCGIENSHTRNECTETVDINGIVLTNYNWYISRAASIDIRYPK